MVVKPSEAEVAGTHAENRQGDWSLQHAAKAKNLGEPAALVDPVAAPTGSFEVAPDGVPLRTPVRHWPRSHPGLARAIDATISASCSRISLKIA
jgi:hypothetical protein